MLDAFLCDAERPCPSGEAPSPGILPFILQRLHTQKPCRPAQLFFDPQQLVVLGNSVRPRSRAGLDLSHTSRYRKVRNKRVFGFARTMRDHRRVSIAAREVNGVERLADRANLIEF